MEKFKKFKEEKMKKNLKWLFLVGLGVFLGIGEKAYGWGTVTLEIRPDKVMKLIWYNGQTGNVYKKTSEGAAWGSAVANNVSSPWTDSNTADGQHYWYKVVQSGVDSDNTPDGFADASPPSAITDLSATPNSQKTQIDLSWTTPQDTLIVAPNQNANGGQMYFKIYRKAASTNLVASDLIDDNLIAVLKASNPYTSGVLFSCVDGTSGATASIRNPLWTYYHWVKQDSEPGSATQYAYAVLTVDTAGVWIVYTGSYNPIGTGTNVLGNISLISQGAGQNNTRAISPILTLGLVSVTGSGTSGTVTLNWSAATTTFGAGTYYDVFRNTMTTGLGTLTSGSLTSQYYIGSTTILLYNDTTIVSGYYYSYAVVIVDPALADLEEKSLLSNDCVILADWIPPIVNILSPTEIAPSYKTSGGTITIVFTYDELNPSTYSITVATITGAPIASTNTICGFGAGSNIYATVTLNISGSAPEGTYNVTVYVKDLANNLGSDTENNAVIIDNTGPAIELQSPTYLTYRRKGDNIDVVFSYTEANPQSLILKIASGTDVATETTIVLPAGNQTIATYTLTLNNTAPDGTYSVYGTLSDMQGRIGTDTLDNVLIIDSTQPILTNIYPTTSNKAYREGTGTLIVEFTYNETYPSNATITLFFQDGSIAYSTITTSPATLLGGTDQQASATLVFNGASDGFGTVSVELYDLAENGTSCISQESVVFDNIPPDVSVGTSTIYYTKGTNTTIISWTYNETNPDYGTITLIGPDPQAGSYGTTTFSGIPGGDNATSTPVTFTNLPNGTYTVSILLVDKVNHSSVGTKSDLLWVDNDPPSIATITSPASGAVVRGIINPTFTVRDDQTGIEGIGYLYWGTDTLALVGTNAFSLSSGVQGTGTYIWDTTGFDDGVRTLFGTIADKAGNIATTTIPYPITVDNKPPDIFNLYPTTGNKAYKTGTNTLIVQFTYTELTPRTTTVSIVGTIFSTTTTQPQTFLPSGNNLNGSATLEFKNLNDGTYTIKVVMEDGTGQFGTCTSNDSLIIDNIDPILGIATPTTTNIAYKQGSDSLTIYYTYTELYPQTLTLVIASGTTEATQTAITLTTGGTDLPGSVTLSWTNALEGTYTIYGTLTDLADNKGIASQTDSLIIDTTTPTLEVYSGSDAIIYRKGTDSITIYYTYTETYPNTLELVIAAGATSATSTTITALTGGTNQTGQTTVYWTNANSGTYTIYGTLTDLAGNATSTSDPESIYIDNTPPNIAIFEPIADYLWGTITGTLTGQLYLKGTATDNTGIATISVYVNDVFNATSTTALLPLWFNRYNIPSSIDGITYKIDAVAEDLAGNQATDTITYIKDSTKPSTQITSPLAGSFFSSASFPLNIIGTANDVSLGSITFRVLNPGLESILGTGKWGSVSTQDQGEPAIFGDRVVWYENNPATGQNNIYLYDLTTGIGRFASQSTQSQSGPAIFGDRVVWRENNGGVNNIYLFDLTTGIGRFASQSTQSQYEPAIFGDRVVWREANKIYAYDLTTGIGRFASQSTQSQYEPAIFGDRVVWMENDAIYLYDLTTGIGRFASQSTQSQYEPAIFGDRVVWMEDTTGMGPYNIYLYDLTTGIGRFASQSTQSQLEPAIFGDRVVWREANKIYAYDLTTGIGRFASQSTQNQYNPAIFGDRVVWREDNGGGVNNIYAYTDGTQTSGTDWNATWPNAPASDGTYTLQAYAYDQATHIANCSLPGATITVIYDSTPPQATITDANINDGFATLTYTKQNGTIAVKFSFTEPNPATFTITIGTDTILSSAFTTEFTFITGTEGTGIATITYNTLPDGTYTLWGTLTDKAGNKGTSTAIGWVIVDTTEPKVEINSPTTANPVYTLTNGTVCINYSYTELNPQTATIYIGTNTEQPITSTTFSMIGFPTYSENNYATLTYTNAPDGTYTIWVVIQDLSDPTGTATGTGSVIVDNTKPIVEITDANTLDTFGTTTYTTSTTTINVAFSFTEGNPQTFTVSIGTDTILASRTITNISCSQGTYTPTGTGTGTIDLSYSNLPDGTYTLWGTLTDKVGLEGTHTVIGWVVIDNTPPIATITDANINDSLATMTYTKQNGTIAVKFSFTEPNPATFTITIGTDTILSSAFTTEFT
ncbi:MAG: hypothetical protein AB1630_00540, partial [bacterium]